MSPFHTKPASRASLCRKVQHQKSIHYTKCRSPGKKGPASSVTNWSSLNNGYWISSLDLQKYKGDWQLQYFVCRPWNVAGGSTSFTMLKQHLEMCIQYVSSQLIEEWSVQGGWTPTHNIPETHAKKEQYYLSR